ncbi:MAG: CDP-alcohol phosphatidyltransferase family protein [Bacteroidales bacterium]|nr:CDP-alcohol phosphatidyltransferase family protein [Bacteroidales bacterium]
MIRKYLPDTLTLLNALCGSIATAFAFQGRYPLAAGFIILAAVFDFFDGFAARLLHAGSEIGKELDSLSDLVSFGLAPSAMVFHFLQTHQQDSILAADIWNWLSFAAFLMVAASALRLARFNLDPRQTSEFIGLPTPANAIFWAFGLVGFHEAAIDPLWVLAGVLFFSWLLNCALPMFSLKFKHFRWAGNQWRYILLAGIVAAVCLLGLRGLAVGIVWYIVLCTFARCYRSCHSQS